MNRIWSQDFPANYTTITKKVIASNFVLKKFGRYQVLSDMKKQGE